MEEQKPRQAISIVIAEDHQPLREKFAETLQRFNIVTIGEASNGKELLTLLRTVRPEVVLLDLNMPIMDGNMTMNEIRERYPTQKVIILSHYDSNLLVDDYLRRGARAYVSKQHSDVPLLAEAIERVAQGEIFVLRPEPRLMKFSRRQVDMIPMICEGLTNKEIANETGIKERAVEKQRQKIYYSVNVSNSARFLRFAFKQGLDFLSKGSKN